MVTVDDEIATGGTNLITTQLLQEKGAVMVWAAVTHGVMCHGAAGKFAKQDCPIGRVFMTNTIPVHNREELKPLLDSGKLFVFDWKDDLAWAIYHHHWDESIRETR